MTYLSAVLSGVGGRTLARVRVDTVDAFGTVLTQVTGAVIRVVLAVLASEPWGRREGEAGQKTYQLKALNKH